MFTTQAQLSASIATSQRDARHANRMANDPAYRARKEQEERDYAAFVERFGHPD